MRLFAVGCPSALLLAGLVLASTVQTSAPAFEVAVVKRSDPNSADLRRGACQSVDNTLRFTVPLGRCVFSQLSLKELLFAANYPALMNLFPTEQLIIGGPAWAVVDHFDVEAKAEDPSRTTHEQLLAMLRSLLAERFKLQIHHEMKELSGYVLVQAKGGAKLAQTPENVPCQGGRYEGTSALRVVVGNCFSAGDLARLLTNQLQAPVKDQTSLTSRYDIRIEYTPSVGMPGATASDDIAGGSSLFTAIQEQLGLKLEPQKIPTDVIIIDAASKP